MELIELLEKLTAAFGPSGCEDGVRGVIADLIAPYVDEVRTDAMGSLIAHKKGEGKKLLFSAHMDTIGMIVTHIEKEGFLRFGSLGWLPALDIRRQGVVFWNGLRGTVSLPEDKEEDKEIKIDDLCIDIGAKNRENAETMVQIGDACVYESPCYTQNGKVFSRYLDNRSGCAVLISALSRIKNAKNDLWFVFSTQEEVGTRGIRPAAYGVDPDVGIAVDVTMSDDLLGAAHNCSSVLGKGPGVKVMDSSVICQPEVVRWMNDVAEQANIAVQQDIMRGGGTDAGAILPTRSGVYAGGICIPCRYTHSPIEVCDLSDIEQSARLVAALAESEFPA